VRGKQIKARMRKGLHDPDTDDPFELFVSSTDIRYTYHLVDQPAQGMKEKDFIKKKNA
jgi:N-acetyltransferase 10